MKYYRDIDKCTMTVFEDCMIDGNLSSLVIEGEVDEYLLQAAWLDIQEQYSVALGDAEHELYVKMLKELNDMIASLATVSALLEIMEHYYHKIFGDKVNKNLQINIAWAPTTKEYDNQLKAARNRIAGMEMRIDIKRIGVEQIEKKMNAKNNGQKASRESFAAVYNVMEEVLSCSIDPSTLTVRRYCERIRRMNSKYKKLKGAGNGRR